MSAKETTGRVTKPDSVFYGLSNSYGDKSDSKTPASKAFVEVSKKSADTLRKRSDGVTINHQIERLVDVASKLFKVTSRSISCCVASVMKSYDSRANDPDSVYMSGVYFGGWHPVIFQLSMIILERTHERLLKDGYEDEIAKRTSLEIDAIEALSNEAYHGDVLLDGQGLREKVN